MVLESRQWRFFDWGLFFAVLLVPSLGLVVLYSAGFDPFEEKSVFGISPLQTHSVAFVKQVIYLMAGVLVLAATSMIPPRWIYRAAPVVYLTGVMLLVAVALFGTVVKGSRRWLDLGVLNLQPAEFMKLGVILAMARVLSRYPPPPGGYRLRQLLLCGMVFLVPMALVMKQPDLGTALVIGAVGGLMMLFVGINWRTLVVVVVMGAVLVVPAWSHLHDYQKNRILSLFNPDQDPKGTGYHINQSKIAVGSGELFGKGFLKGTQTQLEFLPEHTTDFIFSVLGEEWGFVGCVSVLLSYFLLLLRLLRVVAKTKDLFSSLLVVGIGSLLFFHATVNMGMVVGIFPVVGIPLPLFSYGGSALLSAMFGLGLAMGVSMRRYSGRS